MTRTQMNNHRVGALLGLGFTTLIAVGACWNSETLSWKIAFGAGWVVSVIAFCWMVRATRSLSRPQERGHLIWSALVVSLAGLAAALTIKMVLSLTHFEVPKPTDAIDARLVALEKRITHVEQAVTVSVQGRKCHKQVDSVTGEAGSATVLCGSSHQSGEQELGTGKRLAELEKAYLDRVDSWGTMFAWLLGLLAVAVSAIIWSFQRAQDDIKECQNNFSESLQKSQNMSDMLRRLLYLNNQLEVNRQNNPVFQVIRPMQQLVVMAMSIESPFFDAAEFRKWLERIRNIQQRLAQGDIDGLSIKSADFDQDLIATAQYLEASGEYHWLPTDWDDTIRLLYTTAREFRKVGIRDTAHSTRIC